MSDESRYKIFFSVIAIMDYEAKRQEAREERERQAQRRARENQRSGMNPEMYAMPIGGLSNYGGGGHFGGGGHCGGGGHARHCHN